MSIFTPTDDLFFDLFEKQAKLNSEASLVVKEVVTDFSKLSDNVTKMLEIIERGHKLRDDISIGLEDAFMTPYEHEDIHDLSVKLNKVLGRHISALMRMKLYEVELREDFKEHTEQLIDIIISANEEIENGLKLLRSKGSALPFVRRVKKLEQDGDVIQREAIAALFSGSVSAIDIIKWKEIYEQLEKAIDFSEEISLKIDNMIIKHS